MKVIIAGCRDLFDPAYVEQAMAASGLTPTEIVSGGADGIDRLGELWAAQHGIPCKVFKAQWAKHGKSAGPIRNREMADYVGAEGGLVAIWDGVSRGTANMIETAIEKGLRGFIYKVDRGASND